MAIRRTRRMSAVAAMVAIVLAGCANTGTGAPPLAPDGKSDAMVIEVSIGGGLAPPAVRVSDSLPRVWIAGDGRYLRRSPESSGSPALITLEERRIPVDSLGALLDSARAAGLLEESPDFGNPRIADAMVTRVVVVTGGERHSVLIPALGYPNPGVTDAQAAARARVSEFIDLLQNPERIEGVSSGSRYVPTALAVYVLGAAGGPEENPPAAWPLGDLGTAGEVTDWPDRAARCLLVSGDDVARVADAAAGQGRFAPWRAGDGLWDIAIRPLLPDERGCTDVTGWSTRAGSTPTAGEDIAQTAGPTAPAA